MFDSLTPIPPVPLSIASQIAGVNPRRFNEAVADGSYPDAPVTKNRQRRFFEEADVLGMCVFERLFIKGMHKAVAGRMACDVVEHYRDAERDAQTLDSVAFPSGLTDPHGIPTVVDKQGRAIPAKEDREFIATVVRVSFLIEAIRARYDNIIRAQDAGQKP